VRYLETLFLFAHDPIRIIGDLAFIISSFNISTHFLSITGLLCFCVFKSTIAYSSSTISAAISSGNSKHTAHGFSEQAILNEFSKIYGTLAPFTILTAYLVTGFIIEITSII
jgi:hypothetical protein